MYQESFRGFPGILLDRVVTFVLFLKEKNISGSGSDCEGGGKTELAFSSVSATSKPSPILSSSEQHYAHLFSPALIHLAVTVMHPIPSHQIYTPGSPNTSPHPPPQMHTLSEPSPSVLMTHPTPCLHIFSFSPPHWKLCSQGLNLPLTKRDIPLIWSPTLL